MLSATFHDQGVGADDPDFSIDLNRSTATFRTPEISYIILRKCHTSQGDPHSTFPYLLCYTSVEFCDVLIIKFTSGSPFMIF